jgi:uncharacterized repeat protein (TIGR02543 family)
MIGADGYVDLEALGVIGVAIDVNNYNVVQHSMAIRIAGSDNPSLTDSTATLWQTSISNHPAQIVYPSGLVKSRNSAFIPYDDSGTFEGTIVIPLSATGFTNIGGFGEFPSEIQPVMRILPGSMNDTEYESYDFEITGVRFITDASLYATHQITMSQIGGTLSGEIDGIQVTNASNNNVLVGTPVLFTVNPDRGYDITSVTYQMGDGDETEAALDSNHSIVINVTGDIVIIAVCDEIEYVITYDLGGGENHPDNPSMYTVEERTIILEAPTKEGYDFIGWFSGDEPVTMIDSGSIGDIELEARWIATGFIPRLTGWTSDNLVIVLVAGSLIVATLGATAVVVIKKRR